MSRIFGVWGERSKVLPVEDLVATMRGGAGWKETAVEAMGLVKVGWGGARKPDILSRDKVLACLDGSIFNLNDLGFSSPIEAVFSLFREFGFEGMLQRINGDFSIACFDHDQDELWLGRDRIGVKPLYYSIGRDFFCFASRPRPLLAIEGIDRTPEPQYVGRYAGSHYRYIDNTPALSPYRGIQALEAAHFLRFRAGQISVRQYWSLSDLPDHTADEEKLAGEYRELFLDAVKRRLSVAVNPGFTLSGGMDSSSVLASSVLLSGSKQIALSTVYSDDTYDESQEIQSTSREKARQWVAIKIEPQDVFASIRELVAAHDEPVGTATWLSHMVLCKKASELGLGSLFGGLGGDELNAGEYEYFTCFFGDLLVQKRNNLLEQEIEKWAEYHDHPIFKKNHQVAMANLEKLVDLKIPGRIRSDAVRMLRYQSVLEPAYFDLGSYRPVMDHPFGSYLKNRAYQDIFRETSPCCLRAEDRQTEAYGLDNFLPFFDHRVVEFMFRVRGDMKIRRGVTKYLLREAMKGILPEETRTRIKKTGWNAPAHHWFSGSGLDSVMDLIGSRAFRERGIYRVDEVRRIALEHKRIVSENFPVENHMMFLWQLVNLELWLQNLDEIRTIG